MAHRLKGWTAIAYAEKHGGTLKKFADPIERSLQRVSIDKARRVAREDPGLIYMDVKHASQKNPRRVKLPSKFTMMPVRVNKKGEVQIGVNPAKCKNGRVAKNVKRIEMSGKSSARTRRNPRNGYVIYPDSVGKMKLADANREAKRESLDYGKARVESADTEKVVARWVHGRRL